MKTILAILLIMAIYAVAFGFGGGMGDVETITYDAALPFTLPHTWNE